MGWHVAKRIAGRTFRAKCGHKILKGEVYVTFDDYSMYHHIHDSSCVECWNGKSAVELVDGEFQLNREKVRQRMKPLATHQ